MSGRGKNHMVLAMFLILLVLVGVGTVLSYPLLKTLSPVKQTILIVNPGNPSSGQTQIAQTWIDGNLTTDSGTSPLSSPQQIVYVPNDILSPPQTINNVGVVKYGVKTETYGYDDIAKILGYQVQQLVYKVGITVQVVISQTDGSEVYKLNGPTANVTGYTWQTQGTVQVPISGITDVTSALKSLNAPYGTYTVTVTSIESWSVWVYNSVFGTGTGINFPGLGALITCWVASQISKSNLCTLFVQVEGPSTTTFTGSTNGVTYGAVNQATFYMTPPTTQIILGTQSGQTQPFEIGFIPAGGFAGTVTVMFTGMPSGMTITCQDQSCESVTFPNAPPTVTYLATVTSSTQVGNYTITATGTSGSIIRQGTFVIQVITNGNPVACPPVCNQVNVVLAAAMGQSAYAPSAIVTVKGTLMTADNQPVNGGEITVTDQASGKVQGQASTSSSGTWTVTFLAPLTPGTYTLTVAYPGDLTHTAASCTVQYVTNTLPPTTEYLILLGIAGAIIIIIAAIFMSMRKKPGGP